MAVPAHDERDGAFAEKFGLPIIKVVAKPEEVEAIGGEKVIREALEKGSLEELVQNNPKLFAEIQDCFVDEGYSINSGEFSGLSTKEATEAIIEKLSKEGIGEKATNYKLRDWVFSRQRYWGEPIPSYTAKTAASSPFQKMNFPWNFPM